MDDYERREMLMKDVRESATITLRQLADLDCCQEGLVGFAKLFPEGIAKFTKAVVKRAMKAKMDVEWLLGELPGFCCSDCAVSSLHEDELGDIYAERKSVDDDEAWDCITAKQADKKRKALDKREAKLYKDAEWQVVEAWLDGEDYFG